MKPVVAAESSAPGEENATPLVDFYRREMRPFLESRGARHQLLSNPDRARGTFEGLRMLLPAGLQDAAKSSSRSAKKNANCAASRSCITGCTAG